MSTPPQALAREFERMQRAGEIAPDVRWDDWKGSSDAARFVIAALRSLLKEHTT